MTASPKEKKQSAFKVLRFLFPTIFRAAPAAFLAYGVLSTLHGLSWGVQTLFQQRFFDKATKLATGDSDLSYAFFALLFLAGATVACQILNGVSNYIPEISLSKISGKLSYEIHHKISKLAPVLFEEPSKLDTLNKAEQGKNQAVWFVFNFMSIFTFYVPYFIFMGGYLFTLKPVLALSIFLIFLPTAATQIIRTNVFAKLEDESAPVRRKCEYYESCMIGRTLFKETRQLGAFYYFNRLYSRALHRMQKIKYKAVMKTNRIELLMRFGTALGYLGILCMLFNALMKQEISVGAFAAVFSSIGSLYAIMEEVICYHIGSMAQNLGIVRNYLNFLELDERGGDIALPSEDFDIVIRDVTFTYPGSEVAAIKNLNLTIRKGDTLAIVGENGSGKSTLIRLISGLYLPDKGSVELGGIPTDRISFESIAKHSSAIFQNYMKYQMTLSKNIRISAFDVPENNSSLEIICGKTGVELNDDSYPDGLDTLLSREFGGVDLSGGQWQRVAIARAIFKKHSLIILDEPTAAIDPLEETKLYKNFADITKGKTAILVTHRLGSVKLANRIVVLKNGEIAQTGTHEELMKCEGEYLSLYCNQEYSYS